ncbi:ABC transporter substrate-binding protein [Kordiimonas sediminis]|uniref:ABC transporter substrate-binding protein n=1 Tax=Kordiimonas sediminis TaxID=1735581 RepID=A0A919AU43_9PROT|nr:TRAP transporter substrate-binding protein [Kordiimonas sediminis]GHF26260.1 ABC transporter substrate-binding protein [Kordiimonas sediminis]
MIRGAFIGIAACLTLAACSQETGTKSSVSDQTATTEAAPVRWRMTSTYPSTLAILGSMGKRFSEEIDTLSNGDVTIEFFEPGVLAPPFEIFDAVSYGAIEAGWSTPGYWAGKVPALQLFSSVPFGPLAPEYLAWMDYGGGKELFEDIYHKHGIHSVICGVIPPESSGWFKEEIHTLEDLKGKKIRFFGLGGKVLEEIGASPQLISGGEIYQALELGTIDGTEFSMPAVDLNMGFYQIAKHYYFPGWHQQATFFELMINLEKWQTLSPHQQTLIETACSTNVRYSLSMGEAMQAEAMAELEKKGVQFHTWSPEVLDGLRTAWEKVAADLRAKDPEFARAWDSLQSFREKYKAWSDRGFLKD